MGSTKTVRMLGVASLLAGVFAIAAPMTSGAWASAQSQTSGCSKEDNASPTGDANQLLHVKGEGASETSTSTCAPCVTTGGENDHESAQGEANENDHAEQSKTPSTGTTCPPGGDGGGTTGGGTTGGGTTGGTGGSGGGGTVGTGGTVGNGGSGGSDGTVGTGGGSSAGNGGSGGSGGSTVGTGTGTSAGGGHGTPTPPSTSTSGSTTSGSTTTTGTGNHGGGTVASTPAPEVISTSPSGVVVHTVIVPTDVTPAAVPAVTPGAVPAAQPTADIPTNVLAVSTLRDAPVPTLAYTGGSVVKLFVLGLVLLLLGLALLLGSRSRYVPSH